MRAATIAGAGDVGIESVPEVLDGRLEPGRVFDRTVDLDGLPAGHQAMDARESPKVLVQP